MPEIMMNAPEPPEGYEYTGDIREPAEGEFYYSGAVNRARVDFLACCYPILRKKSWVPEQGEQHWQLTTGNFRHQLRVEETCWRSSDQTTNSYEEFKNSQNYFKTEEAAKATYVKVWNLLASLDKETGEVKDEG